MQPTIFQIIDTMEQRGGHFIRRLAELWLAADSENRTLIQRTFATYFAVYRDHTIKYMEVAARESASS